MDEKERATTCAYSLYPRHTTVIDSFARKSGRTPSNAMQYIVTEWSLEHLDQWLTIAGDDGNGRSEQTEQEQAA